MKKKDSFLARAVDLGQRVGDLVADTSVTLKRNLAFAVTFVLKGIARFREPRAALPESGDHKAAVDYLRRGRKHYNKKRYDRALRHFRRAARADESYALAHYYMGLALYQEDQNEAAEAAWKRTTEVAPKSEAAEKAHKKIDYVRSHKSRAINELDDLLRGRLSDSGD